jgi:hypothetical protein
VGIWFEKKLVDFNVAALKLVLSGEKLVYNKWIKPVRK